MSNDMERERFEAIGPFDFARDDETGEYCSEGVQWMWEGWQAARATPAPAEAQAKVLDDPRLQELFSSAILGALAFGAQGTNPPPDGHWLTQFWELARAALAAPPTAGAERTPTDYALEFAEHMAKGAERLLDALEAEDESDTLTSTVTLRSCIYEFRKRRDRAAAPSAPSDQQGGRT